MLTIFLTEVWRASNPTYLERTMRTLPLLAVLWASFVQAEDTTETTVDVCPALGPYHSLFSKPVVFLQVNHTAACIQTCPPNKSTLEQMACTGNKEACTTPSGGSPLVKATCIAQVGTVSVPYFSCVFINKKGYEVTTTSYVFQFEPHEDQSSCVLNDSYHVSYTMKTGQTKWDYVLILQGVSIGLGAMAFIGVLILSCCTYCRRPRQREQQLIYRPTSQEFY